ncbi:enhancer of aba co-receptor 1 [Hibiscus trionum]|uniref:Enhancer of aba co-receptor 1 n=1 Tax=Hibiscus trionum TaxID=183268 RepID=A0A9W7HRU2_HIBTR|nr:enhancer of aba co-receptor 1 [Hibiscus trionum]
MSGPLSKSLGLNITGEAIHAAKKRGILSVLGSGTDRTPTTEGSSLRKILSADMSSKKWLTQNGFSPLKKIASSEEDDRQNKELEKPCRLDIWSSIISKKPDDESSKSLPPPYIHPLVKRSASLSEKSLQICTESLGSETGSDGFSSYPPSDTGDVVEDQHGVVPEQQKTACFDDKDDHPRIGKCNYDAIGKKSPQYGSFPPPIPSLGKDGASVRMETHRNNGRLVLEAVSVPRNNNFLAQRQNGRLVLTFANAINEAESFGTEEKGTETNTFEEEEDMCEGHKGAMNVERLTAMMNKPVWLSNKNPTWPKTFDETVKLGKVEPTTPPPAPVARLFPPPSTINAYEYYWRRAEQPMSSMVDKQLIHSNDHHQQQQQLVVLRGNNGDYFVPLLKGCKETRRSLIYLDPYCIATT